MPVLKELKPFSDADGNTVTVGSNTRAPSLNLRLNGRGARVEIGDDVVLTNCLIEMGGNSRLIVGRGTVISGKIFVGYNSSIIIGAGLIVTSNLTIRAVEATNVVIGDDCLFGTDVIVRTSDGHPVFDAYSRERINPSKSISIGRHVWIADRAIVLKGVDIGDGSAVGAGSVLTKSVPSRSIAAGNPARTVRSNVVWERSPGITTEDMYLTPEEDPR
jgi:acetyltransferase-like isoleucine patch superfamily enzyme